MTLLEKLRTQSAPLHEALHHHPLLAPLAEGSVTYAHYCSIIQMFDHYYRVMEARYKPELLPLVNDIPVGYWLQRDCDIHNISKGNAHLPAPPKLSSIDDMLAYAYVKHGSMLGGLVISKLLAKTLGLQGGIDQYFFHGNNIKTGSEWKIFIDYLYKVEPHCNINTTADKVCEIFTYLHDVCTIYHRVYVDDHGTKTRELS